MTDSHDERRRTEPPRCDECELPLEEITHGYTYEWACANNVCAKRFHPTWDEIADSDLLIIMGQPQCFRCQQPRTMTRWGNIVRFECPNPSCNELVRLIRAKSLKANKERIAAGLPLRLSVPLPPVSPTPAPLTLVPPLAGVPLPTGRAAHPPHLRAVPPLAP